MSNDRNISLKKAVDAGYGAIEERVLAIPERLAGIRKNKDPNRKSAVGYSMKQAEVAEVLGLVAQSYNKIEKRNTPVSPLIKHLVKLSLLYNVSLDYLVLGRELEETQWEIEENKRLDRYKKEVEELSQQIKELKDRLVSNEESMSQMRQTIKVQSEYIEMLKKSA